MAEQPVWLSHLTPLRFLQRSAKVFAERPAVVHGDTRFTYAELGQRVNRLASALKRAGMRPGDRVAYLCPNIPPMLEGHFGVPWAGCAFVPINVRLSSDEIGYILEHSGARLLVVDTEFAPLVEPLRAGLGALERVVLVHDSSAQTSLEGQDYEDFLATGDPDEQPWLVEDENETISINYTSGTTGRPKGVMVTHRGGYLNALGEAMETRLWNDSVYLWTLPMFHCNGWCFPWAVTAAGAVHACLRRIDPSKIWQLVQREGVTHFNAAPTVLIALINDPAARTLKLERKLTVATGGAPPSPTLIGQYQDLGAEIVHVYGLTETYGPHSLCEWPREWDELPAEERSRRKARQGVAYVVADDVRVVDDQMQDVPADGETLGEVVMRGNNVMKGYYQQSEATAEAFRGGWFHSGDLAVMDAAGYIELRDRKKDIIITGGENVSTIEVERALYQHPSVLEVAVIAVPHDRWGEVPKAFVVLKDGQSLTEEALIAFCRERLAHFKCPRSIEFGPLPKTSTGKIQKFVLRDREWSGRGKRIN
jgi:fatty-acyl-CoA synthase